MDRTNTLESPRRARVGAGRPTVRPARRPGSLSVVRDPLRVLLFLLTLVTVSRVHDYLGLSFLRPAFLLVVLSSGYALMNPRALNGSALLRTWPAKLMVALGVMACISVPFGISIGGSASFVLNTYSKVLLFGFLLILAVRNARDLYTFVLAYVVSCGILVGLAVALGVSKSQGLRAYDANDLGLVLLVGLPLTLAIFQSTENKLIKLGSGLTAGGIGVAMAFSMSRGGFLGLVAVGAGLLFLLKGVSVAKRLGFVLVAAGALVVAAPTTYWELMSSILRPTEDYNWTNPYGRRQVWMRGMGYMLSHPVTGIGIGNFTRAEGTLSEPAKSFDLDPDRSRIKWSVAHNSFLETGAEMGIPGFFLFASLVFGGMIALRRLRRRLPASWPRGDPEERFLYFLSLYLPVSLVGFAVTGFFVSFAYRDPIYIVAAFMAGLYAAVGAKMRAKRTPVSSPPGGERVRRARRRSVSPRSGGSTPVRRAPGRSYRGPRAID